MNIHELPDSGSPLSAPTIVKSMLAVTLLSATSCSLPPRESWSRVRQEGLIPVMLAGRDNGGEARRGSDLPADATEEKGIERFSNQEAEGAGARDRGYSSRSGAFGRSNRYPTARPIPGATGYVYSPFAEGDKPVDVSSFSEGVKARCPYTGKIFMVPDFLVQKNDDDAMVAASDGDNVPGQDPIPQRRQIASSRSSEGHSWSDATEEQSQSSPSTILPEPVLPPSAEESGGAMLAEPSEATEQATLEGTRVVGRPGYVRSPYAGSNQLVDVTGLSPGQEVRCPYSGKLFKVPAMGEMSEVSPVEPKVDSSPDPEPELQSDDDAADEVPVVSNEEPEPKLESEAQEKSIRTVPAIVKDGNSEPVQLPADATGLARPQIPDASATGNKRASIPVAKRIAGKKGLVRSPFGSEGQLVDVTGKSPGSQVLCPFTGKPFIVPK